MNNLKQYILEKLHIDKNIEITTKEFEEKLKELDIEIDGPDSTGIVYLYPKNAKHYHLKDDDCIAPCLCLCYSYESTNKYFTSYIDGNEDDTIDNNITLITGFSKEGEEKCKTFNVKNKIDLTKDGKAYACTIHNAKLLANILINKKIN